jgi:hypothetical protein
MMMQHAFGHTGLRGTFYVTQLLKNAATHNLPLMRLGTDFKAIFRAENVLF